MKNNKTTTENTLSQLQQENEELRILLSEAEETIEAIQSGAVDAIVVNDKEGDKIFTLKGADYTYRVLVETMNEGAVTIADDNTVMFCNEKFCKIIAASFDGVIGKSINDFIYQDDLSLFNSIIKKTKKLKNSEEIRVVSKNGDVIPVLLSSSKMPAEGIGFCLIFTELTELKDVQNQLKQINENLEQLVMRRTEELMKSEEKANHLIKYAPTGIYEIDFRTKKFVTVNDAMVHLSGYSREELLSMTATDILEEESTIAFQARIDKMLKGEKQDEQVEYKVKTKDRRIIYVLLDVQFKLDENGRPVGALVVGHDITERRKMEQELKASEEMLRLVLDKSMDGICRFNYKTGVFDYTSPAVARILGYSFEENWDLAKVYSMVHPDDVPALIEAIKVMKETGEARAEYRERCKDGKYIWLSNHISLVRDDEGKPLYLNGNIRDISDRKEAEKALKNKNEELQEINATKDKFFKIIAHDMKNPFISLLGASELLCKNAERYDKKRITILSRTLYDSAKSGYSMLLNLLDWAKSQAGNIMFKSEQLNLSAMICNNLSELTEYASTKKINLTYDIAEDIVIYADKNMMITILRNLINNALKFTPEDGKITVGTLDENNSVTLFVKDSGVGIDKNDFDKLFRKDIKHSKPGTNNELGSGLGLLLCKEFVEKHEGKIWFESELEKGTTFYIKLPKTDKTVQTSFVSRQPDII